MGIAAMLADLNMKGAAGTSDIEDISGHAAISMEGDGTKDNEIMQIVDDAQDTVQPTLNLPQVAVNAGVVTAANSSPPTAVSEQPPPGKPVVEAQE